MGNWENELSYCAKKETGELGRCVVPHRRGTGANVKTSEYTMLRHISSINNSSHGLQEQEVRMGSGMAFAMAFARSQRAYLAIKVARKLQGFQQDPGNTIYTVKSQPQPRYLDTLLPVRLVNSI
eukprot:1161975-Pelagomonas_calceolata.AAC.9